MFKWYVQITGEQSEFNQTTKQVSFVTNDKIQLLWHITQSHYVEVGHAAMKVFTLTVSYTTKHLFCGVVSQLLQLLNLHRPINSRKMHGLMHAQQMDSKPPAQVKAYFGLLQQIRIIIATIITHLSWHHEVFSVAIHTLPRQPFKLMLELHELYMAWCIIKQRIEWSFLKIHRTLFK